MRLKQLAFRFLVLGLCDLLCQAGREAPEIASVHSSKIGIRIENIYLDDGALTNDNSLHIYFRYSNIKADNFAKEKSNYYEEPARYLGLQTKNAANNGLVIHLVHGATDECFISLQLKD